jgi:WD40 repeat protein
VTGGADATVRVWDLTTYEAMQDIELNAVVLGLAVRPDGLVIATTSEGVVAIDLRGTRA